MIDFSLTAEQKKLVERAREFTKAFVAPNAMKYDRSGEFPRDICAEAFRQGFMNSHIPKEYGGAGVSAVDNILAAEEIATGCSGVATAIDSSGLSQVPVIIAGTDEQKRTFLTPMTREMLFSAYAVTEPGAGSDVNRLSTVAVRHGDEYVINGVKWWITNGSIASWYFVLAKADGKLTGFIVPADLPGVIRGPKESNLGQHASNTVRVTFEDVKIPLSYRVGNEGDGFNIAMKTFDHTRPGIAAGANGVARAALNLALEYAKRRRTFDKKLISNQGISFPLAELLTRLDASRMLTWRAAWLLDSGKDNSREASEAKWYASDVAMQAAVQAAQVLGGYGYTNEMPVEKLIRDAKIYQIYEGATEIQKMVIVAKMMRMKEL